MAGTLCFFSEIDDRHSGDNRAQLEDLFVLGRHRGECIEWKPSTWRVKRSQSNQSEHSLPRIL